MNDELLMLTRKLHMLSGLAYRIKLNTKRPTLDLTLIQEDCERLTALADDVVESVISNSAKEKA